MGQSRSLYNSPLGKLLITAEGDHITGLHFSDEEIALPSGKSPVIKKCCQQLDEYFSGKRRHFDVRLQHNGTDFQMKVWQKLLEIPYGKTVSYLSLSKNVGDPKAIRAVGTANGRNNIAILTPCHRVIGSNGNLVGYAGKLWRKHWLLSHEARHAHGVQELF